MSSVIELPYMHRTAATGRRALERVVEGGRADGNRRSLGSLLHDDVTALAPDFGKSVERSLPAAARYQAIGAAASGAVLTVIAGAVAAKRR
jgi:hypothetical protein